jgi:hypothetical protein
MGAQALFIFPNVMDTGYKIRYEDSIRILMEVNDARKIIRIF